MTDFSRNDRSIEVVIVDDHMVIREGIISLLRKQHNVNVIGQGSDGELALKLVSQLQPDVLVLDIGLPKINGFEVAKFVLQHFPDTKVLFLSAFSDKENLLEALSLGTSGYVMKDAVVEDLSDAIHSAVNGKEFYSRSIRNFILSQTMDANSDEITPVKKSLNKKLTKREHDVLLSIVRGDKSSAIADKLTVSTHTVSIYRQKLLRKFNARNTAELVRIAMELKLVS